jgi:hypothetical protein
VKLETARLGDALGQNRLRHRDDNRSTHFALSRQMKQQQWHHVVHGHCPTAFIDRAHAIGITISGEPNQCFCLDNSPFEWFEVLINRLWIYAPEQWITKGANSFNS